MWLFSLFFFPFPVTCLDSSHVYLDRFPIIIVVWDLELEFEDCDVAWLRVHVRVSSRPKCLYTFTATPIFLRASPRGKEYCTAWATRKSRTHTISIYPRDSHTIAEAPWGSSKLSCLPHARWKARMPSVYLSEALLDLLPAQRYVPKLP